jgi:purine-binding chemotaxis protein CheW
VNWFEIFNDRERAILADRAERIARRADADTVAPLTVLNISLHSGHYGILINDLKAVYQSTPLTPVPCTPEFVRGIANLRGHIVPVLDLAMLLHDTSTTSNSGGDDLPVIMALMPGGTQVAFMVDAIGEVQMIASDAIEPTPNNLDGTLTRYVRGVLPDGTILINLPAILNDPAIVVDMN